VTTPNPTGHVIFLDCQCPVNTSGVQLSCDPFSGQCRCPPNTAGLRCDVCVDDFWGLRVDDGCMVS